MNDLKLRLSMKYRSFGPTGANVSILGYGCMRFPVIDGDINKINEPEASRMLRKAIDGGLNYVDTAWPYHGGNSEAFVGRALRDGYREKVYLATKLPSWLIEKESDMDEYLDKQLAFLQTGYIDFYLVHSLNRAYWDRLQKHKVFEFLERALASGKIRHAGFSFHDEIDLFKEIADAYPWSFCQIQFNYLDEAYQAGKEGLEYAAEKGMGIVVMEPLRGGSLATQLPETISTALDAAAPGRTPVSWALNWIWNHPAVDTILSGMSTMEQVDENMALASGIASPPMSDADVAVIDEVKELFRERIRVDCTECQYCMPCPHGINIPGNFFYYNDHAKFDSDTGRNRAKFVFGLALKPEQRASQCVACGECLEHCPQHIPIPDKLKEVAALFEG